MNKHISERRNQQGPYARFSFSVSISLLERSQKAEEGKNQGITRNVENRRREREKEADCHTYQKLVCLNSPVNSTRRGEGVEEAVAYIQTRHLCVRMDLYA